jgi:hypothetical protein
MDKTIANIDPSGQWCLITVQPRKRDSFIKYLNNDIAKKQLQELILETVTLEEKVYEDMILLKISNFIEAKTHLQQIDCFQNIQRLKPNDVSRMLDRSS